MRRVIGGRVLALRPTDGADPLVRLGDLPEPAAGPDEVVVEVEATGLTIRVHEYTQLVLADRGDDDARQSS